MRGFGSDNHAGIHPQIMEAIVKANVDHAASYGTDQLSEQCRQVFKNKFGSQTEIFFVFNGTAANVLALKSMMKSFESCLATEMSHLNVDECGAPEFFAGKIIPVHSINGKLTVSELEKHIIRLGDQHFAQPRVLSLTQPTEVGTVYSLEELKILVSWAKKNKLFIHMDGARLTNAITTLKCGYKEMTTDLGIDVVSFGGTKNGLMFGEAVVFLNPQCAQDFKFYRKQAAQLPSKTRFMATQFLAYFNDQLAEKIASHSCDMAMYLKSEIEKLNSSSLKISYPVQSNAVFVQIPQKMIKTLRSKFFFYVWNEENFECRLMTSWDSQKSDIDQFILALKTELNL